MAALPAMAGKEADEALLAACDRNDKEMAAKGLKEGANPNATGTWREAPALHIALGQGNKELVDMLVKAGADVQLKAIDGDTTLHAISGAYSSFIFGNGEEAVALMRWVLDQGIAVNIKNNHGDTPLEEAAGTGASLVKLLLERGAVPSPQALAKALNKPSRESTELLLKAGVDPKAILPGGKTMMHFLATSSAWYEQQAELAGLLDLMVAKGVEIDRPDAAGLTPLLAAAGVRQSYTVDWLLKQGANVKAVDAGGRTALILAVDQVDEGYDGVVERLCAAGCPVQATDKKDRSALDHAVVRQNWQNLFHLLRVGAVAPWPREVLRDALLAWREKPAVPVTMRHIVRTLLPEAVKSPALRIDGRPLLHELVFLGDPYLLDLALRLGAKPDEQDAEDHTALMWAAAFKSEEMKSLLIKAGADPAGCDKSGKTVDHWAVLAAESVPVMAGPWEAPDWPNQEAGVLGEAIARQKTEVVQTLLAEGKKVGQEC